MKLMGGEDVDPYQGEKEGYLREVGHHAVWSLSSCKPGNCKIFSKQSHTCLRGDQIEVFKIVNGYEDVDRNMFFKLKEGSRTRGHKTALVKEQCRLDMRKYSFSHRVINE